MGNLLNEAWESRGTLPVGDVVGLDLNQGHAGVLGHAGVYSIAQIAEPGVDTLAVDLLDARIVIGGCDGLARDADPGHIAGVLKGDLGSLVVLEIRELLGVLVGKEEEVGPDAFSNGHCAGGWPDTRANGGKETTLEPIDDLVEILELLLYGGSLVPLLGNGGVGLRVNFVLGEWFDHGG